jgi:hypothetical protein
MYADVALPSVDISLLVAALLGTLWLMGAMAIGYRAVATPSSGASLSPGKAGALSLAAWTLAFAGLAVVLG